MQWSLPRTAGRWFIPSGFSFGVADVSRKYRQQRPEDGIVYGYYAVYDLLDINPGVSRIIVTYDTKRADYWH
jgi:hypothetical protein